MSDHPTSDNPDDELADLAGEPLRVHAVDPDTGEVIEGVIYRDHLAAAIIERDEQR